MRNLECGVRNYFGQDNQNAEFGVRSAVFMDRIYEKAESGMPSAKWRGGKISDRTYGKADF